VQTNSNHNGHVDDSDGFCEACFVRNGYNKKCPSMHRARSDHAVAIGEPLLTSKKRKETKVSRESAGKQIVDFLLGSLIERCRDSIHHGIGEFTFGAFFIVFCRPLGVKGFNRSGIDHPSAHTDVRLVGSEPATHLNASTVSRPWAVHAWARTVEDSLLVVNALRDEWFHP